MNGSFFEWRDPAGSASSTAGNFPANYPNTWLRLNRVGNTFTGFASYDGQTWTQLGSDTISMTNQIYLGFCREQPQHERRHHGAIPQHRHRDQRRGRRRSSIRTTRWDRRSRKTPIAFSEIMWKPAPRTDGKNLEFLELYNSNPWFQDISGYQITCADMNYTFPPNTQIPGGGYLVRGGGAR